VGSPDGRPQLIIYGTALRPGASACRRRPQKGAASGDELEDPARAAARQALGRSRGGLTTKVHLACHGRGLPPGCPRHAGNVNDSTAFDAVLDAVRVPRTGVGRPRRRPEAVIADKTSDAVDLSSRNGELRGLGDGECGDFVVLGSFGEAVVEAAEHPVEEVALGGGVAVSVGPPAVVVGSGARRSGPLTLTLTQGQPSILPEELPRSRLEQLHEGGR
jgi:hypothetical protein